MTSDPRRATDAEFLIETRTPLQLSRQAVDIWIFGLEAGLAAREYCLAQLSAEESHRARRFVQESHRHEFIVAHGVLRCLLARYLDRAPAALLFNQGAAGKPALHEPHGAATGISFNLSHSAGLALLAVSDGRPVGADLERVRADIDVDAISRRYFFGPEFEDIASAATDPARRERFFRYWVAKEAALKAQGVGLGFPLDHFHVRFDARREAAAIETFDARRMHADWTVRMLSCQTGWQAAVAAQGEAWAVQYRSCPTN